MELNDKPIRNQLLKERKRLEDKQMDLLQQLQDIQEALDRLDKVWDALKGNDT